MKRFAFAALLAATSINASANCVGTNSFQTCYDYQSGNQYDIQRFGNTTIMEGSNPRTGSRWTQESTTYGNTTYHDGTDSNGNRWSTTCQSYGGQMYCD